jgi:hypothetical protein
MRNLALLLVSSLAWLSAGCRVSAEVETIARTFAPMNFPGAGAEGAGASTSYTKPLKLDLGTSLPRLITELELRRAVLSPVSGVSMLGFVSELKVTAAGDAMLPEVVIARFDAGMPLGSKGEINASVLPVELAPYVQKNLPFEIRANLAAQEHDWALEITLEFRAASDGKINPI